MEGEEQAMAITVVKTPAFSEASTTTWFMILEAQFTIRKITSSKTQFCHAISELPVAVLERVSRDVMQSENYEDLKKAIIAFYESSKPELFEKLMSSTAMTGRPSAYLREMQLVAAKIGFGEDLIRHKFLQALPSSISPALATQQTLSLTQLGSMADELLPLARQINNVQDVCNIQNPNQRSVPNSNQRTAPNKEFTNSTPYGLRPFKENQRPTICRAHIYYNDKAKTCKPWCRYPDKSGCRIAPNSRNASPARSESSENYRRD